VGGRPARGSHAESSREDDVDDARAVIDEDLWSLRRAGEEIRGAARRRGSVDGAGKDLRGRRGGDLGSGAGRSSDNGAWWRSGRGWRLGKELRSLLETPTPYRVGPTPGAVLFADTEGRTAGDNLRCHVVCRVNSHFIIALYQIFDFLSSVD
jgi:hypothetical protein